MRFSAGKVDGVYLLEPDLHQDERGWFAEIFSRGTMAERGFPDGVRRTALSHNHRALTLRGLHYQRHPHEDAKLVTCVSGAAFDVVADVRPSSRTFGQWQGFDLTAANRLAVLVPAGVAHGFETLTDATTLLYHLGADHAPEAEAGIRWDDPTLAIGWPRPPEVVSARDRALGPFRR